MYKRMRMENQLKPVLREKWSRSGRKPKPWDLSRLPDRRLSSPTTWGVLDCGLEWGLLCR